MKRRMLLLTVLILFTFSTLAGCGGASTNTETSNTSEQTQSTTQAATDVAFDFGDTGGLALPISNEKITLKMITWTYPDTPLPENFFTQELEKRTNIKLQIERYPADDPTEKVGLLVASNDLPDLIGMVNNTRLEKWGLEEFVAVNKYLDITPNFKKLTEEKPQILKSYTSNDNNLYLFSYPAFKMGPAVNYGMVIRKDILDKHGIKTPNGPDEYYNAFKQLKTLYPDSYPFINYYEHWILERLSMSWGTFWKMLLPEGSDKWTYGPVSKEYKDMLEYFAKLYSEGLMDPEFMASNEEKFSAKVLQEDKGFAFMAWFGRMDTLTNTAKEKIPTYNLGPSYPIGPYGKLMKEEAIYDYGTAVASSSKNVEKALQLMDYLYSPSGAELVSMGVKGVTYNEDSNGKITYPGFEGKDVTRVELENKYGLCINNILQVADPRSTILSLSERFGSAVDMLKDRAWKEEQPMLKFSEDEMTQKTQLEDALFKAMTEFSTKVIMGQESVGNWDAWVKKNEQLGYNKLEELYNTAYERYKE